MAGAQLTRAVARITRAVARIIGAVAKLTRVVVAASVFNQQTMPARRRERRSP